MKHHRRFLVLFMVLVLQALVLFLPRHPAEAASRVQGPAEWPFPRISIVWPGVVAPQVNVAVWPSTQVSCATTPRMTLFRARNNEPAEVVGTAGMVHRKILDESTSFPYVEFTDVPVAMGPDVKYRFFTDGASNVWVHGADPRTYYPQPVIPKGLVGTAPAQVDARIQVVWPHNKEGRVAPPESARFVNVAVDLFEHGTLRSVPLDFPADFENLHLHIAQGNGPLLPRGPFRLDRIQTTVNGQSFPRWVFNDVPVDPDVAYNFAVLMDGVEMFPSVWTHAKDARTYMPNPSAAPTCIP